MLSGEDLTSTSDVVLVKRVADGEVVASGFDCGLAASVLLGDPVEVRIPTRTSRSVDPS